MSIAEKLRKYVMPNLPYLVFFWFFAKLGEAWRLAEGTNASAKLLGPMDPLGSVTASPLPSLPPQVFVVGLTGAGPAPANPYLPQ